MMIANTMFKHHPRHLYTWISPDSKNCNQIDFFIINKKWKSSVKNVKTRFSDHQLLSMNIQVKVKKLPQPSQPIRFDHQFINTNYSINVSNSFETLLQCEDEKTPNELWKEGQNIFLKGAEESISKKGPKLTNA